MTKFFNGWYPIHHNLIIHQNFWKTSEVTSKSILIIFQTMNFWSDSESLGGFYGVQWDEMYDPPTTCHIITRSFLFSVIFVLCRSCHLKACDYSVKSDKSSGINWSATRKGSFKPAQCYKDSRLTINIVCWNVVLLVPLLQEIWPQVPSANGEQLKSTPGNCMNYSHNIFKIQTLLAH